MQTILCEINVLWMRYSTLESRFSFSMKYTCEIPLLHSLRCLRCLFCVLEMFEKFVLCLWHVSEVWSMPLRCLRRSLFCVFEMSFWHVCAKRKLTSKASHCKNEIGKRCWQTKTNDNAEFDAKPVRSSAARAKTNAWQTTWQGRGNNLRTSQRENHSTQHGRQKLQRHIETSRHCGRKESMDKGGKDRSAKRVGKQQQVTALNLTHNKKRFKHARRKPKQKYEGEHGTEKGTILRRTSLKTTKAKRRPQSMKWYIEPSRQRGFKETRRQRWHGLSEVAIDAKPDSRSGTAWMAGAKTKDPTITLVNCTGDRRRDQESDNQSASLHRWQAHTPTFLKWTW